MEAAPSVAKTVAKGRRSRHGSMRARRVPSPDSACEGDPPSGGGSPVTGDLSENSGKGANAHRDQSSRRKSDNFFTKAPLGQDSDVDSGIVTCRKPGERIGSTSSADTDSSQESQRRIEYSPPLQKVDLQCRSYAGSLRLPKRSPQNCVPVKADHAALKECNGRPPTPLSVFPDPHPCVRFDEQLHLSEQNIRRSCRKLFATLYAQRFSCPAGSVRSAPPRTRSRTAPETELRRGSPGYKSGRSFREERRSGGVRHVHKSASDVGMVEKLASPLPQDYHHHHIHPRLSVDLIDSSHATSTDSGLGSLRNSAQCTCPHPASPACRCCSCGQPEPKLFKSSSCSTLSGSLAHQSRPQLTQFPPRTMRKMAAHQEDDPKMHIQKTSSCSNLLERSSGYQLAAAPGNMIQVYAHIASVIPDRLPPAGPQTGRRAKTLHRLRCTPDNTFEVFRPFPLTTTTFGKPQDAAPEQPERTNAPKSADAGLNPAGADVYSQIVDEASETFKRISHRSSLHRACANQIPKSVGVVVPSPVYLKSALKKPTHNAVIHDLAQLEPQTTVKQGLLSEVEYAVVDKSRKNRFATSLPVLNGTLKPSEGTSEPPVPPKKHLHKSEASLARSRSSSPKKSLLSRMQSALAKAFSTERIYRPEREERREGGLQRSRSFIRGLAGSLRRRKKNRPVSDVTTGVPQRDTPSPEWDERPLSSSALPHLRGQLLQLNLDGSQVVELIKPPARPYGFFVARGRVRNSKGVFVSRMRDEETQKQLAGLLDIGDEILEIDGIHVKDADIMEVNRLMANKNTLLLTVLPYICRKDI